MNTSDKDLLARIDQLAGPAVALAIQTEFGGSQTYIPAGSGSIHRLGQRGSSIAQEIRSDMRLRVLTALAKSPRYLSNTDTLLRVLRSLGHNVSADVLHTELWWLREQGLLTIESHVDDLFVLRLTRRGIDCASGAAHLPGIAQPAHPDAPKALARYCRHQQAYIDRLRQIQRIAGQLAAALAEGSKNIESAQCTGNAP